VTHTAARWLSKPNLRIELGIALVLIFGTILLRWPWRVELLNNFDAVNYALAVGEFDVRLHQTQPPGYYLYITGVRTIKLLVQDTIASLTIFSVLASGVGVYFVYRAGWELFGRRAGLISALLLATSTTFWYQGEIAAPYTGDLAFSALLGWLVLRASKGGSKDLWLAAFVLGASGAYRPQTLFFLAPLLLYALLGRPWKQWMAAGAITAATAALLFAPAILESGGLRAYLTAVFQLASTTTIEHQTRYGYWRYLGYVFVTLRITFVAVGEVLWLFVFLGVWAARGKARANWFLILWFLPTWLVFWMLYPGNPGTILVCIPPFFLWAGYGFEFLLNKKNALGWGALGAVLAWQVILFTALPPDILPHRNVQNAAKIRQVDRQIADMLELIAELPPDETLVFADSFRHMQYYLPEYLACSLPTTTTEKPGMIYKVVCTQDGRTETRGNFPASDLIPEGTRYIAFLDIPPEKLPASAPWVQVHSREDASIWLIERPENRQAVWTPDGVILQP
jgi:4-amino-4-deoxy-L-arabinose transferase-like glycosyltransferase